RARGVPLDEEQARDEKAAEDEERVDAEKTALRPADAAVIEQDSQDRARAHPVERRLVAKPSPHRSIPPGFGRYEVLRTLHSAESSQIGQNPPRATRPRRGRSRR